MSNHVGSSTIYTSTLPNNAALNRIKSVQLSKDAKRRLSIIEHYLYKTRNVSLTCRHFAITRSYFYKWYTRYNPRHLASLENRSRRPHRVRPATYDTEFVSLVRKLRKDYPRMSAKKLSVIIRRDYAEVMHYSAATIGRIIRRFKLYFSAVIRDSRRRQAAVKAWIKRKPYHLKSSKPRQVVEFDMKHIWLAGNKFYAFVAVDTYTKEIAIHLARRPSSYQAMQALRRAVERFGNDICIINDNGSENFGHTYQYLKEQNVTQYFARPRTPKDKPLVENVIGKLQQECLDEHRTYTNLEELQTIITRWLNDYHFFRPHQALNYLTPQEFCATLNITIPRLQVSTM